MRGFHVSGCARAHTAWGRADELIEGSWRERTWRSDAGSLSKHSFQPIQCWPLSLGADMRRREFISLLGGATAWPLAGRRQQPALPVIGFLHVAFPGPYTQQLAAFRQGLKQSGYVEGQNVAIEYRWANNEPDRLSELAADLVSRQVALIVGVGGPPSALAAKVATSTIPIVLVCGAGPVPLRLSASLHPGVR